MSDLTERLRRHIDQMAPHQRSREGGRLLLEAMCELQRFAEWIEAEGERTNACTRYILGKVCSYCQCKRRPVPSVTDLYQGGSDG